MTRCYPQFCVPVGYLHWFYNRYVFPEIYIYNAYLMGFIVHF